MYTQLMDNKRLFVLSVFLFFLCIVLNTYFKTGYYLVADLDNYAQSALEIYHGEFPIPHNHWRTRLGAILPVSLAYSVFGVNEFSTYITSTIFEFFNIVLIYLLSREILGKKFTLQVFGFSAIVFIFSPLSIYLGSTLDYAQGLAFFMFLAVYFFLLAQRTNSIVYYLLCGLLIGTSYLFHSTGIYVFLIIGLYSLLYKKLNRRILYIFLGAFLIFACENVLYHNMTGEWLHRQRIITRAHFRSGDLSAQETKKELKTIENPFTGSYFGDSWAIEPFRQLLVNPVNSILYYLFFSVNIYFLIKKDKKAILMSLLFWPLFLYYSYGSPNPLNFSPLRRLPRYSYSYMIPVAIMVGYGIAKGINKSPVRYFIILSYVLISLFCVAIQGGSLGQGFHQSKFFYSFMKQNQNVRYITDSSTYQGLHLLNKYNQFDNLTVIQTGKFLPVLTDDNFLGENDGSYIFINNPDIYRVKDIMFDKVNLKEIAINRGKTRKICHLQFFRELFEKHLCRPSEGGSILKITL